MDHGIAAPARRHPTAPRRRMLLAATLNVLALLLAACTNPDEVDEASPSAMTPTPTPTPTPLPSPAPSPTPESSLTQMGVSAGHPLAVAAGTSALQQGGTAADAAIAAAFAIAVVEPLTSGIGGGGAALVVPTGDGDPVAYDYREVVPDSGAIPPGGTGIPGFVAGMARLHEAHGALPWAEVLAPAIALARDGHPTSALTASQIDSPRIASVRAAQQHLAPGGVPLEQGQTFVQAELAATMQTLADEGPAGFYTGTLASTIAAIPGLDAASLDSYAVQEAAPVSGAIGEHELVSVPPALPGVALIQTIQLAEAMGAEGMAPGSADQLDVLATSWGAANDAVQTLLGDPAFVDVPVAELTDPAANASLAGTLQTSTPGEGSPAGSVEALAPGNTTHVSVVDGDGLAVSMTNTLTSFWGSGAYVAGFFLNDQLTRFDAIGTGAANVADPGRRSVSWSTPSILVDAEGRPVLVVGTPGGATIPSVLAAVVVGWALQGRPLAELVDAPRTHLDGGTLRVENTLPSDVSGELRNRGYGIEVVPPTHYLFGSVQALEIDHETGEVASHQDTRRDGTFEVVPVP